MCNSRLRRTRYDSAKGRRSRRSSTAAQLPDSQPRTGLWLLVSQIRNARLIDLTQVIHENRQPMPATILVVEDEPSIQELIAASLQQVIFRAKLPVHLRKIRYRYAIFPQSHA